MRTRRIAAGHYRVECNGHVYDVFHALTSYGDYQWVIDRDDQPCWSQAGKLREAKHFIELDRPTQRLKGHK